MFTRKKLTDATGLKRSPQDEPNPDRPNDMDLLLGDAVAGSSTPAVLAPLLIDVSGSIGPYASDLNYGVTDYYRVLKSDDLSAVSVSTMLAQVSTGVRMTPFASVAQFVPPRLEIGGRTDMGEGIVKTLDAITAELRRMAASGRSLNRVSLAILTDGLPSDDTALAIEKLRAFEKLPSASVFPIAVGDSAYDFLVKLSAKTKPARLKSEPGSFTALLRWLAELHGTYSRSRPGEAVEPPPTDAWREARLGSD